MSSKLGFFQIALSRNVSVNAFKVSMVVGSILVLINHGAMLMDLSLSLEVSIKIVLNYVVPYCVSTFSAVKAIQSKN